MRARKVACLSILELLACQLACGLHVHQLSEDGLPSKAAAKRNVTSATELKLAVCIVGQLSRLEVSSKVSHFLEQVGRQGEANVFVVLETNSHHYVNNFTRSAAKSCDDDSLQPSEVPSAFGRFYADGLFVTHEDYKPRLDNWPHGYATDKPNLKPDARAGAHIQQWSHIAACATLIEQHEAANNFKYDYVMKLRDNTLVVAPFPNKTIATMKKGMKKVHVKACNGYGGFNDKVMLAPRQFLGPALTETFRVAQEWERGNGMLQQKYAGVYNPETMLKTTLALHDVPVVEDTDSVFVDGRCAGQRVVHRNTDQQHVERKWCIVSPNKDCHPETNFQAARFPECSFFR